MRKNRLVLALLAVLMGVSPSSRGADAHWQTFGQDVSPWESSNPSMDMVSTDFNRYHHFVGTPRKKVFVNGGEVERKGSLYIPFGNGPYRSKSVLEVKFNNDKDRTVARFRFLEKIGSQFSVGKYSTWQTKDFGSPHGFDRSSVDTGQLTFYSRETFDRTKWLKDIWFRSRQTWDLLHSTPIIGMSRTNVVDLLGPESPPHEPVKDIGYYQITATTDNLSAPLKYLELKYVDGKVVAFRIEQLRQIGSSQNP
jgi:hypothetical protein